MLAVAAAAHALDGLYGSVKRYVQRPTSKARRPRQILETLKHGFVVGKQAQRWMAELDWLFDLRDSIVHHGDDYGPLRVVHESEDLLVAVPVELSNLSSKSAARAAWIAREIVDTCRSNPKPLSSDWVRGPANWEPGPGERIYPGDLERRTFPLVRD